MLSLLNLKPCFIVLVLCPVAYLELDDAGNTGKEHKIRKHYEEPKQEEKGQNNFNYFTTIMNGIINKKIENTDKSDDKQAVVTGYGAPNMNIWRLMLQLENNPRIVENSSFSPDEAGRSVADVIVKKFIDLMAAKRDIPADSTYEELISKHETKDMRSNIQKIYPKQHRRITTQLDRKKPRLESTMEVQKKSLDSEVQ